MNNLVINFGIFYFFYIILKTIHNPLLQLINRRIMHSCTLKLISLYIYNNIHTNRTKSITPLKFNLTSATKLHGYLAWRLTGQASKCTPLVSISEKENKNPQHAYPAPLVTCKAPPSIMICRICPFSFSNSIPACMCFTSIIIFFFNHKIIYQIRLIYELREFRFSTFKT